MRIVEKRWGKSGDKRVGKVEEEEEKVEVGKRGEVEGENIGGKVKEKGEKGWGKEKGRGEGKKGNLFVFE